MRPLRLLHAEESGVRNSHFDVSGILETWKYRARRRARSRYFSGHEHESRPRLLSDHGHAYLVCWHLSPISTNIPRAPIRNVATSTLPVLRAQPRSHEDFSF